MATYLEFETNCEAIDFFIEYFKRHDKNNAVENTFLYDQCYYFAIILKERFNGVILYDTEGHFVTKIEDHLYDIRGDVTDEYKDKKLLTYDELKELDNFDDIKCGCIDKYVHIEN